MQINRERAPGEKGGDSNGQIESFLARMAAKISGVLYWVMGYVIPERKPCMSMKILKILCLSSGVVAFSIGRVLSTGLSATEMQSTWGGVLSCYSCTGHDTCSDTDCVYSSGYPKDICKDQTGGTFSICALTGDPDDTCSHTKVACGTQKYCDEGSGGCTPSTPNCGCSEGDKAVAGCNP